MKTSVIGWMIGLGMLADCSGTSVAAVVVYDNSDQTFFWKIGVDYGFGEQVPGTFLDITQPPSQAGDRKPGTFGKWYQPSFGSGEPAFRTLWGEDGAEVARTTDLVTIDWAGGRPLLGYPPREYSVGETITSNANWFPSSIYYYHLPFSTDLSTGTPAISKHANLGVRVKLADGQWHYGWILFTDYQWPLMWAYETEPDTPITVPVPAPSIGFFSILTMTRLCSRRR